jgi:hypothetical protein
MRRRIRGNPDVRKVYQWFVIACDKRNAFAQGSVATKQSIISFCGAMDCVAALAMT